jgi:hypothetical protein
MYFSIRNQPGGGADISSLPEKNLGAEGNLREI